MLSREELELIKAAWWDGPFQETKNVLCDMALDSLTARERGFADAREQDCKATCDMCREGQLIDKSMLDVWYHRIDTKFHTCKAHAIRALKPSPDKGR